jgi:serine/threonine-protein kinase RIO1
MNELLRKSSLVHADLSLGPIILAVSDSVSSATPEPTDVSDLRSDLLQPVQPLHPQGRIGLERD